MKLTFLLAAAVVVMCGCATSEKSVSMEFRLATEKPTSGFREVYLPVTREKVYLSPKAELTAADVKSAQVVRMVQGPAVGVTLRWSAARRLGKLTDEHIGDYLVILVNGRIVSAPLIKGKTGSSLIIVSNFTEAEARELAAALSGKASTR